MTAVIGLLLAAGAGRRMGMPKALVEGADGQPWVLSSARTLLAGGCDQVVVVLGAAATEARALLSTEDNLTIVEALDWQEGMGASLRVGLNAIADSTAAAALVHLVDLPDVGQDVIRRIRSYAASGMLARASYGSGAGRTFGHPVLLGREHWAAIAAEAAGDAGARSYLARHDLTTVDCSDLATGADVDNPSGFVPKLGR